MYEAFGCVKLSIPTPNLTSADIDKIRQKLVRPQKTRPKKKPISGGSLQLSPRSQRRLNDSLFVPPIPYPVQFVDVETMDFDSEYFLGIFQLNSAI